jgi:Flp pilus assembly protein protease CpaA
MTALLSALALIPSAIRDYREREVSKVSYLLLLVVFVIGSLLGKVNTLENIIYAVLIFGVLFIFALLTGGLGGGDIKIMALLTLCIGGIGAVFSLFIGFFFMVIEEVHKRIKRAEKRSIPVVTYLCVGTFIYSLLSLI